jgi:surfeit locus 1 family protein
VYFVTRSCRRLCAFLCRFTDPGRHPAGAAILTTLAAQLADEGRGALVNRRFIPQSASAPLTVASSSPVYCVTEPGGGFLRRDPAGDRWFSRDVGAIAQARGLASVGQVAPYFVDADAASSALSRCPASRLAG